MLITPMATLFRPLLSPPSTSTQFFGYPIPFPSNPKTDFTLPSKSHIRIQSSKFGNFLDLEPQFKSQPLNFDLPFIDPSNGFSLDVIVIGTGPAGLRLAENVASYGIRVLCIDPAPLSMWPNNYGVWVDEFENLGLENCLDKTWPMARVYIDDNKSKYLDRPYGRVGRKELKTELLERCVSSGVKFHKAKVWKVEHKMFDSMLQCDDGHEFKANLVVDASGFASTFTEYDKPRNHGYQIAHGILAEVESHPFDLDKMILMDWRDSHMGNEPYLRVDNSRFPTFLYVMPFDSNLIFLEETSLVSRPVLPYMEVKRRMVARLRHLGIKVKRVLENEKCLIPMGGPLPKFAQNVMPIGGTAGLVHPSTGYTVARSLALAPLLAEGIAECLGLTRMIRGTPLHYKLWNELWPIERRATREFYTFGMETLLKLDLNGNRRFFSAFFDLEPHYWEGFLSSKLSLTELLLLSLSLFGNASNLSKLDIVTKCPVPLARFMKPDIQGIKVAVKCDDVKNMTIATAERDGSFIVKLPMDAKLKCLAKLLGGPKQLYAQRKDMVADVVEDDLNDESYTISNPLAFSTRCPVALTGAKCGTISSSKTIDLPIPPEWGLAPTSYYLPVFPIIGVP